jgi:hypothetical protein
VAADTAAALEVEVYKKVHCNKASKPMQLLDIHRQSKNLSFGFKKINNTWTRSKAESRKIFKLCYWPTEIMKKKVLTGLKYDYCLKVRFVLMNVANDVGCQPNGRVWCL